MHRVGDGLHHYTWKETGEEREDFEERREGGAISIPCFIHFYLVEE